LCVVFLRVILSPDTRAFGHKLRNVLAILRLLWWPCARADCLRLPQALRHPYLQLT
jgi:hypothetical protein